MRIDSTFRCAEPAEDNQIEGIDRSVGTVRLKQVRLRGVRADTWDAEDKNLLPSRTSDPHGLLSLSGVGLSNSASKTRQDSGTLKNQSCVSEIIIVQKFRHRAYNSSKRTYDQSFYRSFTSLPIIHSFLALQSGAEIARRNPEPCRHRSRTGQFLRNAYVPHTPKARKPLRLPLAWREF